MNFTNLIIRGFESQKEGATYISLETTKFPDYIFGSLLFVAQRSIHGEFYDIQYHKGRTISIIYE